MVCLCLFLSTFPVFSQQYDFRTFTNDDGLKVSIVDCIYEDSRGYLWVGTMSGGVARYDGKEFITYQKEQGLINDVVYAITEDADGQLWFGTEVGISIFDGIGFHHMGEKEGLSDRHIKVLKKDQQNGIWIGTNGDGLFYYKDGEITNYHLKDGLPNTGILSLEIQGESGVWVGTQNGLCFVDRNADKPVRRVIQAGLSHPYVYSIMLDSRNRLWIGTELGVQVWADQTWDTALAANFPSPFEQVTTFTETPDRKIWIGSHRMGLLCWDGQELKYITQENGLTSNLIRCLYTDRSGYLWTGTFAGLNLYYNRHILHYSEADGLSSNQVFSIHQDHSSAYWFGTLSSGINRMDESGMTVFKKKDGLAGNMIMTSTEDKYGNQWIGTGSGLSCYDGRGFTNYYAEDGLPNNFVFSLLAEEDTLWIGTREGSARMLLPEGKPQAIEEVNSLFPGASIFTIFRDQQGKLWMPSFYNGIFTYDHGKGERLWDLGSFRLDSMTIACMSMDRSGVIWAGTNGQGLLRMTEDTIIQYTLADGLTSLNIWSVITDHQGHLWLGTEKGLDHMILDPASYPTSVSHVGREEGFKAMQCTGNAVFTDQQGFVWFGTQQGVYRIDPLTPEPRFEAPPLYITGVRLFFQDEVDWAEFSGGLSSWFGLPKNLILPYDQNHISFDFSGVDLKTPEKVRYQYRLDGLDRDWSPPLANRQAVYSNIPPGSYNFQVRTVSEDGRLTGNSVSYPFVVRAAFWQTWWFIVLSGLAVVGLIWFIAYLHFRRVQEKMQMENRQIRLENELMNLERKALRLQMNPHFIFNSLDAIGSFIFRNDPRQATTYLSRFARLMRLILESSKRPLVPVHYEVETLNNYLSLEQLRFNHKFDFEIEVDPAIRDDMGIPPMLIQPQVENAILHGIGPKDDSGVIRVNFLLQDQRIHCEVTDNGIGRKKAGELKEKSGRSHRSMALQITRERLAAMEAAGYNEAHFKIEDLKDQNGAPQGTKTIFDLPLQYI